MNTEEQAKLLYEAFSDCDIEKLAQAIDSGIDLNMTDKWGIPLWDEIKFIFDFDEESRTTDETKMGDKIVAESQLYEFMDLAISHGLNLNTVVLDAGEYFSPLFWLIYYCYSSIFLEYLISKGADINLIIGKQTLLDRIDEENWFDSEIMESRNEWMEWVAEYLREHGAKSYNELCGSD